MKPQPHGLVGPSHCTDQVTPPGATSFATVALMVACVFAIMLAGGSSVKFTVGVTAVMVVSARPGFPEGAVAIGVADMITTPPDGIVAGAT